MPLIGELEARLETEGSPFRAQLLREDIARLRKLVSMAGRHETVEPFAKEGLYIGWTQGDFRTHEVRDTILALLAVMKPRVARRRWTAPGGLPGWHSTGTA